MPSSCMTSTTSGCTCPAGSATLPAESALCRPVAARSNSAWLICERPALCRHTNSTWLTPAAYSIDNHHFNRYG